MLGILLSAAPTSVSFRHCLGLIDAALARGLPVCLYCIEAAVVGVDTPELQRLRDRGLRLFACAAAAQQHAVPVSDAAVFCGLSTLSEIIANATRFIGWPD